jgi:membrane-bound ClpP family serine protease
VVLGFASIGILLVRLGVAAQRRPAVTGVSGMVGQPAQVVTAIAPGMIGRVSAHGEIWQAIAGEPISPGARVSIVKIDGLTLTVRKD